MPLAIIYCSSNCEAGSETLRRRLGVFPAAEKKRNPMKRQSAKGSGNSTSTKRVRFGEYKSPTAAEGGDVWTRVVSLKVGCALKATGPEREAAQAPGRRNIFIGPRVKPRNDGRGREREFQKKQKIFPTLLPTHRLNSLDTICPWGDREPDKMRVALGPSPTRE